MLTHSKTSLEDKKQKKNSHSKCRYGEKKITLGKKTLAIGYYLNSYNSKPKTLSEHLQILISEFLSSYPNVPSKTFANLRCAQVTFCHFSQYPRQRDYQDRNGTITDQL